MDVDLVSGLCYREEEEEEEVEDEEVVGGLLQRINPMELLLSSSICIEWVYPSRRAAAALYQKTAGSEWCSAEQTQQGQSTAGQPPITPALTGHACYAIKGVAEDLSGEGCVCVCVCVCV